jgi:nucleotide-binding universal stress UspA family protein
MPWLNRVLIPIDLSSSAPAVLRYGCFLADVYGASVDILHVKNRERRRQGGSVLNHIAGCNNCIRRQIEQWLLCVPSNAARTAGVTIAQGDPATVIAEVAGTGYELVVLGQSSREELSLTTDEGILQRLRRAGTNQVLPVRDDVRIPYAAGEPAAVMFPAMA